MRKLAVKEGQFLNGEVLNSHIKIVIRPWDLSVFTLLLYCFLHLDTNVPYMKKRKRKNKGKFVSHKI